MNITFMNAAFINGILRVLFTKGMLHAAVINRPYCFYGLKYTGRLGHKE